MTKELINKQIGLRISNLRKNEGYTQEELANELEISRGHLSCLEIGTSELGTLLLYKLCIFLNCEVSDILPSKHIIIKKSL